MFNVFLFNVVAHVQDTLSIINLQMMKTPCAEGCVFSKDVNAIEKEAMDKIMEKELHYKFNMFVCVYAHHAFGDIHYVFVKPNSIFISKQTKWHQ